MLLPNRNCFSSKETFCPKFLKNNTYCDKLLSPCNEADNPMNNPTLLKSSLFISLYVLLDLWKRCQYFPPNHPYSTLISQLLKEASKPSKRDKIGKGQQWKEDKRVEEKNRLPFILYRLIWVGNKPSCCLIRSVINKSDSRCGVVRFCYHSYDYRPNWTQLSPSTITYRSFYPVE